jgi:hypothetical protein
MPQNESFTCPDCYSEVPGTAGVTLTCATCRCEFNAVPPQLGEDELSLAPLAETPEIATAILPTVTGNADSALHLEEEESTSDQLCQQCNQLFDVDAMECVHCGFNVTLGRNFDPMELDPYYGVYGFDRYLMRHTQESNPGGLMVWLHVFLVFSGIATMLVWSGWAYFVVPMLAIIYTAYRLHAKYTKAFHRGKGMLPKVLLLYNRLTIWKGFTSGGMEDGCILSKRSSQFNDNSIACIEDLAAIEIMDIAGSSITDSGVRYLSTLPNLKALVVVNCRVGEDALDELQDAKPEVCIWRP